MNSLSPAESVETGAGPGRPGLSASVGRTLLRARLLLSSYAPLNLILAARIDLPPVQMLFVGLALVGLGDAIRLTLLVKEKTAVPRAIQDVRDSGAQVAGYLATYLLPLLAAPEPDLGDLIGYGIYGLVLVVITLRSDLAHINPTLYLLGWKVVTVTAHDETERYLVCRKTPRSTKIHVVVLYGVWHEAR